MERVFKMFVYPHYVSLESARTDSPEFFKALDDAGITCEKDRWNGATSSIPTDEPGIVRASSRQDCTDEELARFCHQHGHLLFHGSWQMEQDRGKEWGELIRAFLKKAEKPSG